MSKKNPDQNENAPRTDSSAEQKQPSRRKLLKSIAAGGGVVALGKTMPEQWSKPMVDSVVVPAHAQATQPERSIVAVSVSVGANLLDFFIQTAHAAPPPPCVLPTQFCVERNAGVATFFIDGGTASTQFTEGGPFNIVVPAGATTYSLTNVVITGNDISGTITCTTTGKKGAISGRFAGPFVVGSCT